MTPAETRAWHEELVDDLGHTLDPLRRATLCDINTWLSEDLLMKFDRMTMAHSIEGRAPYLQPRLAQAAFALPTDAKRYDGVAKVRLREVAFGLLPESILRRPKKGWVLPMDTWLREDLHDEFIDSVRACPEPIIDRGAIEQLVRADRTKLARTSADVRCTRSWSWLSGSTMRTTGRTRCGPSSPPIPRPVIIRPLTIRVALSFRAHW